MIEILSDRAKLRDANYRHNLQREVKEDGKFIRKVTKKFYKPWDKEIKIRRALK